LYFIFGINTNITRKPVALKQFFLDTGTPITLFKSNQSFWIWNH